MIAAIRMLAQVCGDRDSTYPPHPFSALSTAWMINVMSTLPPLGMPCEQVEDWAVPRSMFTSVMSSFTVTAPLPSQSPTQEPAPITVGVGVGDGWAHLLMQCDRSHEVLLFQDREGVQFLVWPLLAVADERTAGCFTRPSGARDAAGHFADTRNDQRDSSRSPTS